MTAQSHGARCRPHPRRSEVVRRMRRIEGQIRGIVRMLEEDRPCYDILVQCAAARAALARAYGLVLKDHIGSCVVDALEQDAGNRAVEEVEDVLDRLLR